MLGHVLRGPTDGPAYSLLVFAFNTLQFPGWVRRPQTNFFSLIRNYLSDRKIFLKNLSDLLYLRNLSLNKVLWRRLQLNQNLLDVNEKD